MNVRKRGNSYQVRKQYKGKQYVFSLDHKPTQKEIFQLLAEQLETPIEPGTFEDFANKYIKAKENVLSPGTVYRYMHMINYFSDDFKALRLDRMTQEKVQSEINQYAISHSPKSTKDLYGFVTAVCGLYRPNLALRVTIPQQVKNDDYMPTTDEVRRVLEYAKGKDTEIPLYLATLGLRRSEIMAVTYKDLSDDNWLTVNKGKVKSPEKGYVVKTTKTYSGTRKIPIPKPIADIIREQKYEYKRGENYITKNLHKYQDALGIPWFKLHAMRHHFAALASKFFGKGDTKNLGGWSSDQFMEKVYWYSLTEDKDIEKSVNDMFDYIFKENAGH